MNHVRGHDGQRDTDRVGRGGRPTPNALPRPLAAQRGREPKPLQYLLQPASGHARPQRGTSRTEKRGVQRPTGIAVGGVKITQEAQRGVVLVAFRVYRDRERRPRPGSRLALMERRLHVQPVRRKGAVNRAHC
ncbi:hypothetical protein I4F81_005222 [Pyropia yezoensis]|uniref:Uncharacterized protein n=1 Tax=Pyropia yezoensis TaxID=2788 RepID=A0ACC3BX73_PYRYE|nr:hypothetical protein I4F81_005222 [Neopyropia yezoensis]